MIATDRLPVFKYPVVLASGSGGMYFLSCSYNVSSAVIRLTIDDRQRYWFTGDNLSGTFASNPHRTDLVAEVQEQFHSLFSITSADFRFQIDAATQRCVAWSNSTVFSMDWANSSLPMSWFGYTGSISTTGGGGVRSGSYPVAGTWLPEHLASVDTYDVPAFETRQHRTVWGRQTTYRFDDDLERREIGFDFESRSNVIEQFSSTVSGSLEKMFVSGTSQGRIIRFYESRRDVGSGRFVRYLPEEPGRTPWKDTPFKGFPFYEVRFRLRRTEND